FEAGCPTGITDHRDSFLAALNIAIADDDLGAFARKRERRGAADSGTSASYQRDLSFKFFHDVDLLDRRIRLTTQIWRIFSSLQISTNSPLPSACGGRLLASLFGVASRRAASEG